MLCLNTRDNWAAATITITIGVTSHVWTCPASALNAYDAIVDFTSWLPGVFSGQTVAALFARNPADAGLLIQLSFSTTTALLMPNGAATSLLGFTMASGTTVTATASAWGSWAPAQTDGRINQALDYPMVEGSGDAGGAGAIRAGVPAFGLVKPRVDAFGSALDAGRLTAMLANAPSLRLGWFFRTIDRTWRQFSVGPVARSSVGHNLYKFTFDVGR